MQMSDTATLVYIDCQTHVFDIRAWVNGNNIAVLDSQVMSNHTIHSRTAIIQIIICKDDENSILALLALYKHGITAEQL